MQVEAAAPGTLRDVPRIFARNRRRVKEFAMGGKSWKTIVYPLLSTLLLCSAWHRHFRMAKVDGVWRIHARCTEVAGGHPPGAPPLRREVGHGL